MTELGDFTSGQRPPGLPPVAIDPSLADVSPLVHTAYAQMNSNILSDYYHNAMLQNTHIVNSHHMIWRTAAAALARAPEDQPSRALLLGAGNCLDIPLEKITESFDHTTIVDANPSSIEQAVAALPKKNLSKISLVGADLTGVMAGLATELDDIGKTSFTYGSYIEKATAAAGATDPANKQPELGGNYDFVCSQLLMTQLGSIPLSFLNDYVIAQRYGASPPAEGNLGEPLVEAYGQLSEKLKLSHVDYLARLVAKTGTVHFADTVGQLVVVQDGIGMRPMVTGEVMDHMDAQFTQIREPETWNWLPTPEHGFVVLANAYAAGAKV